MKRTFLCIMAFLLTLSFLLSSCKAPSATEGDGTPSPDTPGTTAPDGRYIVTEKYLPEAFAAQMKSYFESTATGFYPYDDRANAPLVSTDVFAFGDARLKSITIPVFTTMEADAQGNFLFTISVLPSSWATLRTEMENPDTQYEIKINAAEYGLEEKTMIRKFIKVDLTAYDIKLSGKETLGFSSPDDTILPGRVVTSGSNKAEAALYMIDNTYALGYYYYNHEKDSVGDAFSLSENSLLFDFELERTYESKAVYDTLIAEKNAADAAYAEKLAAVKAAYAGKSFSLIGDSISTYSGVTNSTDYHPAIYINRVHYTENLNVSDYTKTYWGKLSKDTGMDLCVINSWSAGRVYGGATKATDESITHLDNMLTRSYQLTNKNGDTPELIFLYYAINDMNNSPSSINESNTGWRYTANMTGELAGDLYQRLTNTADTRTQKQIVEEWFGQVQAYAADRGYRIEDASTVNMGDNPRAIEDADIFLTWEAAYALSLQNMKRLYPEAELFVFTMQETNHSSGKQDRLDRANIVLRALAEYFGADVVNQQASEITRANCHIYGRDTYGLHPNVRGHAAITKLLVETLYEKLNQQ